MTCSSTPSLHAPGAAPEHARRDDDAAKQHDDDAAASDGQPAAERAPRATGISDA